MLGWLFLGAVLLAFPLIYRRDTRSFPPGPRGLPILGSALDLPSKFIFRKFDEWAQQYDGLFMFSAAGQKFLVVTRSDVAAEILEKRSLQTADRPTPPMAVYMLRHMAFTLEPYNDRWRRCRRVSHESFNIRASENYRSIYEEETKNLINDVAGIDPLLLGKRLTQFMGILTYRAMYGSGTGQEEDTDKKILRVWEMAEALGDAMSPATFLVNLIPALGLLPESISKWKQYGTRWYTEGTKFLMGMAEPGLEGQSESGFVASCVRMRSKVDGISDEEIAWTSFALYGAGVETTPYTLHWFILAMILNPEVFHKVQSEVDAVAGSNPPTFEDRGRMPYLAAVMKETLRWRPVLPIGLPHMAAEDFEFKNYVVPKGTYIFGSSWNMCRDPSTYPDYDNFRPERFLDEPAAPEPPVFGFGRRICPGRDFAQNALFLAMSNLLWAYDFNKVKDEDGKEITPSSTDFDGNLLCVITSRRERHRDT
ncbi:cytochrome P450 [Calocera viscosa TUFC12733]|uniref:Cytochrome P450 n=1 Tax=Calocera viscosa (strain TUFC12733) TaxID=1330018 RepID=A0A167SGA4_CALVF|nr:cytochrome P450 [Calocera viscosa TUFC12733]